MDQNILDNLRGRADAKMRYAAIHLAELRSLGGTGTCDRGRAYLESLLFHLFGAKEAFLIELNAYYSAGVAEQELSAGKLRDALKKQGTASPELAELYSLEHDETSWLFHAKGMRDNSTHVAGVPRQVHWGGPNDGEVYLRNPSTGQFVEKHFWDACAEWLANMSALLERLRTSAIVTMRSNSSRTNS